MFVTIYNNILISGYLMQYTPFVQNRFSSLIEYSRWTLWKSIWTL